MTIGELVFVALLIAIVGVSVFVVQRLARSLARLRRRGRAGEVLADTGRSVDLELDLVLRRVEAVRVEQIAPAEIVTLLAEAADTVGAAAHRAKALSVPSEADAVRDAFVAELMHSASALEKLLDACLELEGTTHDERRQRAQASLKWGQLNLIRARQSLVERSIEAATLAGSRNRDWRPSRI
jgi:ElaB/YqjD/DUF883 family membrane-anchored ribosome-binding protein